jgi:glucose-6-phosphate 1-dehydrogenase
VSPLHRCSCSAWTTKTCSDAAPDAYERLLAEAIEGDHGLFSSQDVIDAAGRFVAPALTLSGAPRPMPKDQGDRSRPTAYLPG